MNIIQVNFNDFVFNYITITYKERKKETNK